MDDENKAVVLDEAADNPEIIKMAADACPVQCISLE
jgi:ferredoxin